jgi:hypothetical protein
MIVDWLAQRLPRSATGLAAEGRRGVTMRRR